MKEIKEIFIIFNTALALSAISFISAGQKIILSAEPPPQRL